MTTQTTDSEKMSDVQQQLLDMLNSVELDETAHRRVSKAPAPDRVLQPANTPPASQSAPAATPTATTANGAPASLVQPAAGGVGTTTAPAAPQAKDVCPKCASAGQFTSAEWCTKCGFYPKLNRCINMEGQYVEEQEINTREALARMPAWLWVMLGGMVGVLAYAITIRILVPPIEVRGVLGLWHVVAGICLVVAMHVRAFLIALKASVKTTLASMISQPLETWRPAARDLPNTRYLFYTLVWGATLTVVSLIVIDLHWSALFSPTPKQKKERFNPMAAVMKAAVIIVNSSPPSDEDAAMYAGDEPDMEASLEGFADLAMGQALGDVDAVKNGGVVTPGFGVAGEAGLVEGQVEGEEEEEKFLTHEELIAKEREAELAQQQLEQEGLTDEEKQALAEQASTGTKPQRRPATQVVGKTHANRPKQGNFIIFGYTLSVFGNIHSVVVAESVEGSVIRYVDTVPVSELSEADQLALQAELDKHLIAKPILKVPFRARWVEPVITCNVAYKDRKQGGRLEDSTLMSYRHK